MPTSSLDIREYRVGSHAKEYQADKCRKGGNIPQSQIAGGAYNPKLSNSGRVTYSYKTGIQMMNELDAMTKTPGALSYKMTVDQQR